MGEMMTFPEILSAPQVTAEMPVRISSLPSQAHPAISATAHAQRAAVSCTVKNTRGGKAILTSDPILSFRQIPPQRMVSALG
uniref:hypothetical protein n=1 Tax=Yoonia sp. TaxID=2212373 RepID=UPI00404815D7